MYPCAAAAALPLWAAVPEGVREALNIPRGLLWAPKQNFRVESRSVFDADPRSAIRSGGFQTKPLFNVFGSPKSFKVQTKSPLRSMIRNPWAALPPWAAVPGSVGAALNILRRQRRKSWPAYRQQCKFKLAVRHFPAQRRIFQKSDFRISQSRTHSKLKQTFFGN